MLIAVVVVVVGGESEASDVAAASEFSDHLAIFRLGPERVELTRTQPKPLALQGWSVKEFEKDKSNEQMNRPTQTKKRKGIDAKVEKKRNGEKRTASLALKIDPLAFTASQLSPKNCSNLSFGTFSDDGFLAIACDWIFFVFLLFLDIV